MPTERIQLDTIDNLFTDSAVKYIFTARNKPNRAIVVSNKSGNYELHAVDFKTSFSRQVTHSSQGTLFGSVSANGEFVYVLNNDDGSEHGHFHRIPFLGGEAVDITPEYEEYFAYEVSDSNNSEVIAMRVTVGEYNKILTSRYENGVWLTSEVYASKNSLSEVVCSPDGSVICCGETISDDVEQLVFIDLQADGKVTRSKSLSDIQPLTFFSSNQNKLLGVTKVAGWQRPFIYNSSNENTEIITNTAFEGDIWILNLYESDKKMLLCDVYQAEQKLYLYDTESDELQRIGPETGSFNFHFGAAALGSENSTILRWSDFNTSPRLIEVSNDDFSKWRKISKWSGNISSNYKIENIHTNSTDGETVQAWMVKPNDASEQIPFVIDIHGGPHGVVLNEFSPQAQAWLRNGFGYCAVNYRGSISFGEEFKEGINGDPGYWETEDVVAVRNWLIDNSHADPDHVILHGWSWGGYVALLALGKYPDLWSAGIAGNAIADCIKQYEDESAYFRSLDKEKFAGTPETNRKQYLRSSPITYTENIKTPILIIHGKKDVRCPAPQMENFINKLEKSGKSVQVEWFNSGHVGAFTNTDLQTEMTRKSIQFVQ